MSVKSLSIILAFTFLTTFAGAMKNKKDLLYMLNEDLNDQSALQTLKDFADEIFQLENSTEDLYEFVNYFLTVNLEETSPYGGLTEEEQLDKLQQEVSSEIQKYFQEQSEKKEFNFIEDKFMTVFNRVRDTYERYFLAIIGKKIRLNDTEIQLPFTFARSLFEEVKKLQNDENFKEVFGKKYISKLNELIKFINENQKLFQDEYDIYLNIYIKYALLRSSNYRQFSYQIDELFEKASYDMNASTRDAYLNRIYGMVKLYLQLNPSEDAVTQHFRNKELDGETDEEDNRSENEIKRDYKDTLILRLQTMRIESMESDDTQRQQNLSHITDATIKAFVDNNESGHLFFLMRQMALQNVAIPSSESAQVSIIRRIFEKEEFNWEQIKEEADQLKDEEVHPQVLFLADVMTLPIFDEAERTKGEIPEPFNLLYRNILAIPQKILRGNAVLQVLGHYAIAKPNEEKIYYQKIYQLLQKFRLQNSFNLDLLENHVQSTTALNFFIDQQYDFEREVNSDQNLLANYFKFKTTIVLHMLAFLDKTQIQPDQVEEVKKMYQIKYKQATQEELQELDEFQYDIQRPGNFKTDLYDILQHFANHWESKQEFTRDVDGLKNFSENTFNVYDISGGDMKDRIRISITENEGSTFKFPVDIALNFKIGLYGADALHYNAVQENKNKTAGEKAWQKKNSFRNSSSEEKRSPQNIYRKKKQVQNNGTAQTLQSDESDEETPLMNQSSESKRNNLVQTSSDEDDLQNRESQDRKGGKINLDETSEDSQLEDTTSFKSDNRSFSDMENDREQFILNQKKQREELEKNSQIKRQKNIKDVQEVSSDSLRTESQDTSEDEQVLNENETKQNQPNDVTGLQRQNRIKETGDNLRLNRVKFISGQPLNQKEEEFLQDPQLLQKLSDMKKKNGKVSFDNDDGSVTEVVYLQIIPYGSDCFRSYQDIFVKN